MAGARLNTVSSSITWSVELSFCGLVHDSGPPRSASTTGSGRIGDGGAGGAVLTELDCVIVCATVGRPPTTSNKKVSSNVVSDFAFIGHLVNWWSKLQRSRAELVHWRVE